MARKFSRFIKKQKICPSHPFVFRPRTVQVISILIMSKLMFIGQLFLELSCWSDCWAKTTKTPLQAKKYGSCKEEFYDNFELNFEFKPFELQTLSPWTWKFPKSRNRILSSLRRFLQFSNAFRLRRFVQNISRVLRSKMIHFKIGCQRTFKNRIPFAMPTWSTFWMDLDFWNSN